MLSLDLSIVVPALNEESRIATLIDSVRSYMASSPLSSELVVIDDGSTDRTASIVATAAAADRRVRLIHSDRRGKGAAVRRGMLEARGSLRFMADADLAVPMDQLPLFLNAMETGEIDVVIASREAAGATRVSEAFSRRVFGRVFNVLVQILAVPGLSDTQCGFKMLRAEAAEAVIPHLTVDGFAFDVEMLFVARKAGFQIREVGVLCKYGTGSSVTAAGGITALRDVLRVRLNALRGRYDHIREPRLAEARSSN